jgi:hypothetical protein
VSSKSVTLDVEGALTRSRRSEEFDAVFDRVWEPSVRLASRLVGPDEAEDIAVEAFARALERWNKVRSLPHLDAWLLRVTTNVALDRLRRTRRQPASLDVAQPAAPEKEIRGLSLTVRNEGEKAFRTRVAEPIEASIVVPGTRNVVATSRYGVNQTLHTVEVEPGREERIAVSAGLTPCGLPNGFALPAGRYALRAGLGPDDRPGSSSRFVWTRPRCGRPIPTLAAPSRS